jgi:hypothetical protein
MFAVAGGRDDCAAGGLPGSNLSRSRRWRAGLLECPSVDIPVPSLVAEATARARREGLSLSCDPAAGRLLAVLAARLPAGARVLEPGTGTGAGTAWIAAALLPRTDVTVITVEKDPGTAALAPHGLLIVDDMTAAPRWDTGQHARQQQVRQALLTSPLLTSVELRHGSGVILSTRHA